MKISIDKDCITLSEVEKAKEFAQENAWIDKEIVTDCARKVLQKYYKEYVQIDKLSSVGKLEVTKDHWEMAIWASDVTVQYWHHGPHTAIIGMNLTDNISDNVHAFLQVFDRTYSDCI